MRRPRTAALALTLATTVGAAGCSLTQFKEEAANVASQLQQGLESLDEARPSQDMAPTPPARPSTVAVLAPGEAVTALALAPTTGRRAQTDYRRDAFGTAWSDVDGNGCNQRDDVLLRDAAGSVRTAPQGRCEHDVLAGTWIDPYDGTHVTLDNLKEPAQARAIQIDHVVPLAEAWRSGAAGWDETRRRQFANDLDVLVAATGRTNASKADSDPAAWRPRAPFQCDYALRWITVKSAYGLAVDDSERRALSEMLQRC